MNEQQAAEVEWYLKRGRYRHRIRIDGLGQEFVIGDLGWNSDFNPKKDEREWIENQPDFPHLPIMRRGRP